MKRGETEYLLSALPLGGYVKMIGEDPGDESPEAADPERSFSKKSVGTRSLIILAGPLANLILPVVIFWGIFTFVGQAYFLPVTGSPENGSPAAKAGLVAGDRIQAVDGKPIERWDEIETALRTSAGEPLLLTVLRDGRTSDVPRDAADASKTRDIFGQEIDVWDVGLHPLVSTRIGQVLPGQVGAASRHSGAAIASWRSTGHLSAEWDRLAKIIHGSPGQAAHADHRAGRSAPSMSR